MASVPSWAPQVAGGFSEPVRNGTVIRVTLAGWVEVVSNYGYLLTPAQELAIYFVMTKHATNGKTHTKVPDKVRQSQEAAQELARAQAERMFTPVEPQAPAVPANGAHAPEPSLEQRLADIDRRAKERASEEKRQLANHYLQEARNAFRRAVSRTTDEAVKTAYEEMQRLEKLAGDTTPAPADGGTGRPAAGDRPTRERRSPDSLRSDAQKLADWLRGHPASKGSAAVEATGVVVKQPLNVRTFVEKYLPGTKVKTDGQKAGTLYSIG